MESGSLLRTLDIVEEIDRVRRENAMLLEIFDLTDDLAILLDAGGRLLHMNAAAKRFYALDDESAEHHVGRNWEPANDRVDQVILEIIEDPDDFVRWSGEIDAIRHDGRAVPMLVQLLAHRDRPDGPIEFFSAVGRDISDQKLLESSLEQQATHDPLTGLPNRVAAVRAHPAGAGRSAQRRAPGTRSRSCSSTWTTSRP